eukprot:7730068-Pyramimonas_sp.AAC.1
MKNDINIETRRSALARGARHGKGRRRRQGAPAPIREARADLGAVRCKPRRLGNGHQHRHRGLPPPGGDDPRFRCRW